MDILIFGAHPDDVEFGMGGSLLKFVREGKSAAVCVLSRGGGGTFGTKENREREMQNAAEFAGVALEVLDFEDCQILDSYENRLKIAAVIRKYKPKVLFAPYHTNNSSHVDGASHPDHLATGTLVQIGARYARFKGLQLPGEPWKADALFYYILPQFMQPDFIVDVTDYIAEWEQLCGYHASQMPLKNGNVIAFLKKIRAYYGLAIESEYGEAFVSDNAVPFSIDWFLSVR